VLRTIAARPAASVLVTALMALGMAAGIVAFCLADAVLWHPVPFRDPERLVHVRGYHPAQPVQITVASAALDAWSGRPQIVTGLYFWSLAAVVIGSDDRPEAVTIARVSPGLISELGMPIEGRDFSPSDRGQHVAILNQATARARFGAPHDALGRTMQMDGELHTIVGVAPAGFEFPNGRIAAWLPESPGPPPVRVRAIARVRPELTFARAAELTIASTRGMLERRQPEIRLAPFTQKYARTSQAIAVAVAASLALLLVGVVNASNILLAETVRRTGELAVRRSLGATTGMLARQIFLETMIRAAIAFVVALGLVSVSIDAVASGVPRILTYQAMRPISLDWRAVVFAAVAAFLVAAAASVAPCLRLARVDVQSALQNGSASFTPRTRIRAVLTIAQMAATLVLLACAALLVNGFIRLVRVDPGYDAEGLTVVDVILPGWRYANLHANDTRLRQLRDAVEGIPGVTAAAVSDGVPPRVSLEAEGDLITPDGRPFDNSNEPLNFATVDDHFLSTLEIPLVAGRGITELADAPEGVVTRSLATRLWPGRAAIGRRLRLSDSDRDPWFTVVGVVGDMKLGGFDDPLGNDAIFLNRAAMAGPPAASPAPIYRNIAVRSSLPAPVLAGALRAAVRRVVPGSPIVAIQSAREMMVGQQARVTFVTKTMAALAIVAMVIAMVGIYGAFWCAVSDRRREIGVRLAVGADPRRITRMIIGDSLRQIAAAVAVGAPLALATSTALIKPLLFEISPADPATMALACIVLAICGVGSAYLPARRAGATDPVETLRAP
jgi:predicted permease